MRTIEIDFAVHKRIEAERKSFADTPNDILRRLLGLPYRSLPSHTMEENQRRTHIGRGVWMQDGVVLPPGTKLKSSYRGRSISGSMEFRGEIDGNGKWSFDGRTYDTPSGAYVGEVWAATGKEINRNGWLEWEVRRPDETRYVRLQILRSRASRGLPRPD